MFKDIYSNIEQQIFINELQVSNVELQVSNIELQLFNVELRAFNVKLRAFNVGNKIFFIDYPEKLPKMRHLLDRTRATSTNVQHVYTFS